MNDSISGNATYQSEPMGGPTPNLKPQLLVTGMFVIGLLGFLLVVGRTEIARWRMAAAINALEDGQFQEAVDAANAGLKWNPEYSDLIVIRARAKQELQDFDGCLKDADQLIAMHAKDEDVNEEDMNAIGLKANCLQRMEKFQSAVDELTKVVKFRKHDYYLREDSESRQSYALSLNNRAYVQALGGIDIKQALEDINTGLELFEDPIMIDTQGYLMLLNGNHEEALKTLKQAVEKTETENLVLSQAYRRGMRQSRNQVPFEKGLRRLNENLAVILHHRGEAYEANGDTQRATADKKKAIQLGYDREAGIW